MAANLAFRISYAIQPRPEGLAQAILIGRDLSAPIPVLWSLATTFLMVIAWPELLKKRRQPRFGSHDFRLRSRRSERYGVVSLDLRATRSRSRKNQAA